MSLTSWGQASYTSPCDWPVSYAACEEPLPNDDLRVAVERMAIDLLWNWTGRVFGTCPATIRPCRINDNCPTRSRSSFWGRGPYPTQGEYSSSPLGGLGTGFYPVLIGGEWFNCGCGQCLSNQCSCQIEEGTKALRLPGPVVEVTVVLIDGVAVPSTEWKLSGTTLVRTDGGTWPLSQNLLAESSEPDTFEVTYTRGIPVPLGGQVAVGLLACELSKAALGDPDCGLPQRVQTVTRQGVTVAVLDSFEDVGGGRTGLWLVDSWVASITGPKRFRPTILSPDYRRREAR